MYSYRAERIVKAPPEIVWAVIADVEGYARHAPNLSRAYLVGGARGVGIRRRCIDVRGAAWEEICTVWEEGSHYTMEAEPRGYPYPMRLMRGTWGLQERRETVLVYMQFDYQPKFDLPLLGAYLDRRQIRPGLERISQQLLDSWEREIHNRAGY